MQLGSEDMEQEKGEGRGRATEPMGGAPNHGWDDGGGRAAAVTLITETRERQTRECVFTFFWSEDVRMAA